MKYDMVKPKPYSTFEEVKHKQHTVAAIISNGGNLEDCLLQVCNHNLALINKIMDLELIVPKIVILSDGKIMLYRCPEDLLIEILQSQND